MRDACKDNLLCMCGHSYIKHIVYDYMTKTRYMCDMEDCKCINFKMDNANNPVIKGVGKDAPIIENALGAKQSAVSYRVDLLPARATLAVSAVLKHGAEKYGENNWHGITVNEHINHALIHTFALLAGDIQDDHLEHAATRLLMALEIKLRGL